MSRLSKLFRQLIKMLNQLDCPTFMPNMRVPLWQSILIDYGRFFTLGLWKPKPKRQGRSNESKRHSNW